MSLLVTFKPKGQTTVKKRRHIQNVLVGRRKRPAILQTTVTRDGVTFAVVQKGKVIATRSTSKTQDEEAAIVRLSKAVKGLAYVFVIPVSQDKDDLKKRYFKVNN
jgi:uncharacterized YccA/Bax inhibitor family protein